MACFTHALVVQRSPSGCATRSTPLSSASIASSTTRPSWPRTSPSPRARASICSRIFFAVPSMLEGRLRRAARRTMPGGGMLPANRSGAMQAFRLYADGMRLDDVPAPEPRPGEILLRVAGAGACHSDLHVEAAAAAGKLPWPTPFTLGHEITGWVESTGEPVAVYCAWGCGRCGACARGCDNYCENFAALRGAGLGLDGGMAPFVVVPDARYLVPLGDLEPRDAAPLA